MNKEIEFKYNAANIALSDFIECFNKNGVNHIVVSGEDHFYSSNQKKATFFRIRQSEGSLELTYKRKLEKDNNDIRIEHNISTSNVSKEYLEQFIEELGYKYLFNIFKVSYIFDFEHYKTAYYICYDSNMKEIGRFIEIEMKEDYDWKNEEEAWNCLVVTAKVLKPLGLDATTKMKLSLYELYKPKGSKKK